MFKAYRELRKYSDRSRPSCVRFQISSWWGDLKWWPGHRYRLWVLRRAFRKNPKRAQEVFDELRRVFKD